ncbi:helix-turn-helix domain-containing protein [Jinshanibacter sp. LJY008]|uniref:Helix-turn-helix domain-containing protein n=1 Tax=Limnobaculum eriocheiris TaxID=2897391 RepID=A0A9X1MSR1_9GAMM|nr:helix-turn-helix domain-containing protein [Limnobaculum eriocheiris]MCD1124831.1 helix-turn-helix domain-containing protein [Limnobaculum eriocheiris]
MTTEDNKNNEFNQGLVDRLNQLLDKGIKKAEMSRAAGLSPQAVNNWFKRGQIGQEAAKKLALKYDFSVDWLLNGTDGILTNDGTKILSPKQQRLLELFDRLPDEKADELINQLEEQNKYYDNLIETLLEKRKKIQL